MTVDRIAQILESIPAGWTAATVTASAPGTVTVSAAAGVLAAVIPQATSSAMLTPADDLYPATTKYPSNGGVTATPMDGVTALWAPVEYGTELRMRSGGITYSALSLAFDMAGTCCVIYRGKV